MKLCEFCLHQQKADECSDGYAIPKKMRCSGFAPVIQRFCATPADYEGRAQLKQMAEYFGMAGKELQRVMDLSDTTSR